MPHTLIMENNLSADSFMKAVRSLGYEFCGRELYKFLDDTEEGVFYISVEEGDVLITPYRITLTISAGLMFE